MSKKLVRMPVLYLTWGLTISITLATVRVRTVGELLANVCRSGLARTERVVRERMTLYDQGVESLSPGKLINPKALTTVVRDFFARSQLSQFMDQINPLAEMTTKEDFPLWDQVD